MHLCFVFYFHVNVRDKYHKHTNIFATICQHLMSSKYCYKTGPFVISHLSNIHVLELKLALLDLGGICCCSVWIICHILWGIYLFRARDVFIFKWEINSPRGRDKNSSVWGIYLTYSEGYTFRVRDISLFARDINPFCEGCIWDGYISLRGKDISRQALQVMTTVPRRDPFFLYF